MVKKPKNIDELLDTCPVNKTICDNMIRAWSIINRTDYKKILCSISGGADSDVMLDIIWKCDIHNKVDYVWFDTGLEYRATKDHLKYLENKYGIEIIRQKAIKAIPLSCKIHGQPFMSKHVSEMMYRLQSHGFQWEDKPFDDLYKKYPKCKSALMWWCNSHGTLNNGKRLSSFNINYNRFLKEFIVQNPPQFKISGKCCNYAKKDVSHKVIKDNGYDLSIIGVRKAEGGVRASRYKSCFDEKVGQCDQYRPIFWYLDSDKSEYCAYFKISHSDCYSRYGLKRTGCCGCPFGKDYQNELNIVKQFEPRMYNGICNIFKDSYEYTKRYREFVKERKLDIR